MPVDIIVYALVAAGLIFWLRSILGTRHGDEKTRPNSYETPSDNVVDISTSEVVRTNEGHTFSSADKVLSLVENPVHGMSVDNKAAEDGLLDIVKADKDFDVNFFLEGAQEAFVIVVEAFGEGDRETLKDLLAAPVYKAFDQAIVQREETGEVMQTEIHAIKKAEIIEAQLSRKMALITVRFTADETSVLRDSKDKILSGHPDKVTLMRDIWVFSREIRSRDPRWFVHETRGDFEGDNETIPNSDKE